jgi:hypothetical protein
LALFDAQDRLGKHANEDEEPLQMSGLFSESPRNSNLVNQEEITG